MIGPTDLLHHEYSVHASFSADFILPNLLTNVVERTTNHEGPHYAQFSILLFLLSHFQTVSPVSWSHSQQTFNSWKCEALTNTSKQQITQHSKMRSSSVLSLPQIKRNKSSPCMQVIWRSGGKTPFILNLGNGWGLSYHSSRPGSLYPGKRSPGTLCTDGWF